ncbi:MAG: ATP-binding protein [Actinomycetota bacterium]|nr:ATP-binding protein [Actinomycetota bacterium]
MEEVQCLLPREPQAPFRARRAVEELTHGLLWRAADVMLVVSELVTNSLRHAPPGEDIKVVARRGVEALEVEVCDPGPGFDPPPRGASNGDPVVEGGGLGLAVVDALTDAWGVRTNHHACVWARFQLGA